LSNASIVRANQAPSHTSLLIFQQKSIIAMDELVTLPNSKVIITDPKVTNDNQW